MSEITKSEPVDVPSKARLNVWMNKLERTGVPTELECGKCGTPTVVTVPRDEKDDENQKTICESCLPDTLER